MRSITEIFIFANVFTKMVPQNEQSQLSFMPRFNIILELIPKINLALNWISKSIVCSQIQKKNQIDRKKSKDGL